MSGTDAVLTVQQPYASAILLAGKDVENRTWSTEFRGRLWIHAAARSSGRPVPKRLRALVPSDPLPRGLLLGHVILRDVVRDAKSTWRERGCFHWVLDSPFVLADPIPYKGRLGLTYVDRAMLAEAITRPSAPLGRVG